MNKNSLVCAGEFFLWVSKFNSLKFPDFIAAYKNPERELVRGLFG